MENLRAFNQYQYGTERLSCKSVVVNEFFWGRGLLREKTLPRLPRPKLIEILNVTVKLAFPLKCSGVSNNGKAERSFHICRQGGVSLLGHCWRAAAGLLSKRGKPPPWINTCNFYRVSELVLCLLFRHKEMNSGR